MRKKFIKSEEPKKQCKLSLVQVQKEGLQLGERHSTYASIASVFGPPHGSEPSPLQGDGEYPVGHV